MTMSTTENCFRLAFRGVVTATLVLLGVTGSVRADAEALRLFQPSDVHKLQDVSSFAISPEGDWVAYSVRQTDVEKDKRSTDLYMVSWDGEARIQLTHTESTGESHPRFSPDGKYLAFLTSRSDGAEGEDDPKAKSQVWLLNRAGGEARRLTELKGGVSGFEWSPDSSRLVLVGKDPEADEDGSPSDSAEGDQDPGLEEEGEKEGKGAETPKPIVIDRYQFKQDREGYLTRRYERLYLFDIEEGTAELLTPGDFDSTDPAWSPDGHSLAFTSKRPTEEQPDPDRTLNTDIFLIAAEKGAQARRLTTWEGSDSKPTFAPNGESIAYVRGPEEAMSFYAPSQLGVLRIDSSETPILPTAGLDRSVGNVRWSPDGRQIYFGFEDDRERFVGRVPAIGGEVTRLSVGRSPDEKGVIRSFEIGARGIAALASFPHQPSEIYRLKSADGPALALTDHNAEARDAFDWANVRAFDTTGEDGVRVGSMLLEPPGYTPGRAYPTVAFIHGGPVGQDGFEFDAMAQAFAAAGFLVIQPNYRGSSGRGAEFSTAIYGAWGSLEIQDIHTVVDALVAQGLSDPKRLAIGGWSYGGINTNYAIATDTRFAAAVSGSGIANLLTGYGTDQYIWQYEGEIGKPWEPESLERYLELSYPFLHADRIQTPTLFMCGEKDFNVPLINSEQMYQALKSLDVPTQLVIYPGQYHGLSVPSYIEDRIERMIAWFNEHMPEESLE